MVFHIEPFRARKIGVAQRIARPRRSGRYGDKNYCAVKIIRVKDDVGFETLKLAPELIAVLRADKKERAVLVIDNPVPGDGVLCTGFV